MNSYRIIGARKDDGALIDEVITARTMEEAESKANSLGVYVSEVALVESHTAATHQGARTSQAPRPIRRSRRSRRDRRIIRAICTINAVLLLIPGIVLLLISIAGALMVFIDRINDGRGVEGALEAAISVIGGSLLAIVAMLIGALLYMLLFIEQWLWDARNLLSRLR